MPTALIVDDEPEANWLLARLVQLRGYRTLSAYNGRETLDAVRLERPDILFLDLMLPDTTGYSICESLKSDRQTHDIPVVIVTARLAAENRVLSFRHGAVEFILKPYTPSQIFAILAATASWPATLAALPSTGEIPLLAGDEVAAQAGVGRLWSLLLARTSWEAEEIRALALDLGHWLHHTYTWGRTHQADRLGSLSYAIEPECFSLTFRDDAGWNESSSSGALAGAGRFDEIVPLDGHPGTICRRKLV